jgi:calcineurin-like phosphoesterase family protein
MNVDTLVLPDNHENPEALLKLLDDVGDDVGAIVSLGDWWDSREHEDSLLTRQTTEQVKRFLHDPKWTMLLGNHDACYRWRATIDAVGCSGFSWAKHIMIHDILSFDDWQRFKCWTRVNGWLLSHAGVHPSHVQNFSDESLALIESSSVARMNSGRMSSLFAAGEARGGYWGTKGGVTWLDWNRECEPIPGINQMVGHTAQRSHVASENNTEDSKNLCIDTQFYLAAIIRVNGEVEYIRIR